MNDSRRLRSALFVDFDNVYIGLQRLDPAAAESFATAPTHWLAGLTVTADDDGELTRRFLVRSCYLNPSRFAQFRAGFTRAGFAVVDCPSLTQQGKSSADINLVLDAVDALAAPTRYDEFVIVSADADFTPLALRCRAADRRVTVVTASPAASAYRAVADQVVTADELVDLVGTASAPPTDAVADVTPPVSVPAPAATETKNGGSRKAAKAAPDDRRSPAVAVVLRLVRGADRPYGGSAVAQAATRADPALPTTDWAGTGRFAAWLTREVPELAMADGFVFDPRRFSEADLPGAEPVDLPPLQRQVVEVTDIPNLTPERYAVLLRALAEDVAAHPFDRVETARRVHEACQRAGEPIGRASVNAVISGDLYSGLDLAGRPDAARIASTWADYVVGLCKGARMELGGKGVAAIRTWVGGGLVSRG